MDSAQDDRASGYQRDFAGVELTDIPDRYDAVTRRDDGGVLKTVNVWKYEDLCAYADARVAAERERCAAKLNVTRAEVLLAAGEMSAQEWRTVSAVLQWMQRRIRQS